MLSSLCELTLGSGNELWLGEVRGESEPHCAFRQHRTRPGVVLGSREDTPLHRGGRHPVLFYVHSAAISVSGDVGYMI